MRHEKHPIDSLFRLVDEVADDLLQLLLEEGHPDPQVPHRHRQVAARVGLLQGRHAADAATIVGYIQGSLIFRRREGWDTFFEKHIESQAVVLSDLYMYSF